MPMFKINLSGGILTESKFNCVRRSSVSLALSQEAITQSLPTLREGLSSKLCIEQDMQQPSTALQVNLRSLNCSLPQKWRTPVSGLSHPTPQTENMFKTQIPPNLHGTALHPEFSHPTGIAALAHLYFSLPTSTTHLQDGMEPCLSWCPKKVILTPLMLSGLETKKKNPKASRVATTQ